MYVLMKKKKKVWMAEKKKIVCDEEEIERDIYFLFSVLKLKCIKVEEKERISHDPECSGSALFFQLLKW